MVCQSEGMKAIPRALAGTAVVLAAVLTTAPLTAGIADFVLNPGHPPGKRAASEAPPADHADQAQVPAAVATTNARVSHARRNSARTTGETEGIPESASEGTRLEGQTLIPAEPRTEPQARAALTQQARAARAVTQEEVAAQAHETVSAEARIAELAADLRAGVEAGEMTEEDAARVLEDLSSYIRGERTWPERRIA